MGQYACWLEPAIFNEWIRLMQSWRSEYDLRVYDTVFQWVDASRDTSVARALALQLQHRGAPLRCVWTEKNCVMKVLPSIIVSPGRAG
jgi:hypothetical protein